MGPADDQNEGEANRANHRMDGGIFAASELNRIAETAFHERLAEPACRSLLLGHLNPYFRAMLEHTARPDLQIRLDLMCLNRLAEAHSGEEPALAIWLETAAHLSTSSASRTKFYQWGATCRRRAAGHIDDAASRDYQMASSRVRHFYVGLIGIVVLLSGVVAAAISLNREPEPKPIEGRAGQASPSAFGEIFALDVPGGRPVRARTTSEGVVLLGALSSKHAAPRGLHRLNLPVGTTLTNCDAYPVDSAESLTSCFEAALAATTMPFATVRLQIIRAGDAVTENLDLEVARP